MFENNQKYKFAYLVVTIRGDAAILQLNIQALLQSEPDGRQARLAALQQALGLAGGHRRTHRPGESDGKCDIGSECLYLGRSGYSNQRPQDLKLFDHYLVS